MQARELREPFFSIHSVYNSIISELFAERGSIPIQGVELIKAFNIWEDEASIDVPICRIMSTFRKLQHLLKNGSIQQIPGIVLRKRVFTHGVQMRLKRSVILKRSSFFSIRLPLGAAKAIN